MSKLKTSKSTRHDHGYGALAIYQALRDDILALKLEPGVLIDETTLASRFNVSRSPVREALAKLAIEGLTKTLPNKGTIVAPLVLEEFPDYIDALDLVQRAVTRLAAVNRKDSDLHIIRERQDLFKKTLGDKDIPGMIQTNRDFHLAIGDASGNRFLTESYQRILDEGRRSLLLYYKSFGEVVPQDLAQAHEDIIMAITNKDADLAERLAGEHVDEVQNRFINFFAHRTTQGIGVVRD